MVLLVLASSCELVLSQLLAGCGTLQAWAGETASLVTPVSSCEAVAEKVLICLLVCKVALKLTPDTRTTTCCKDGEDGGICQQLTMGDGACQGVTAQLRSTGMPTQGVHQK